MVIGSGLGSQNRERINVKITKRSYGTKTPILQLATDESSRWDGFEINFSKGILFRYA